MQLLLLLLLIGLLATSTAAAAGRPEPDTARWTAQDKRIAQDRVRELFVHAYDSYMLNAFPSDELRPLSCDGINTWGGFALTLVDALDTLAVMGNRTEFVRAVELVAKQVSFDRDENTSVFEANIRGLGGLLAAHLLAIDDSLHLKPPGYQGELLDLARDLGERLLTAFDTPTRMPFGTVNLRHGVPPQETPITCTAGIGTFLLEFGVLSDLTGDERFRKAAKEAIQSLWSYRSPHNMVGMHINTADGTWLIPVGSIGGGSDSFYEYLLKAWIVYDDDELMDIFDEAYKAIEQHQRLGAWHVDVNMNTTGIVSFVFESLKMFWPGLQVLFGDVESAFASLQEYRRVFGAFVFPPERVSLNVKQPLENPAGYFLRPEQMESILYMYGATRRRRLLTVGWQMVVALEKHAKVPCGVSCVSDVETLELNDRMESFFLAETLKYLFLLFDDGTSLYYRGNYVLTTEAHLVPVDPSKRRPPRAAATRPEPSLPRPQSKPRWRGQCPVVHWLFGYSITGLPADTSTNLQCIPTLHPRSS